MKPIGLASDHAGFELKQFVKALLDQKKITYKDFGTYSEESCNYAVFAHALANSIETGEVDRGIAICGSGNGISMTLNKHQGIRAALCWNAEIARLARLHNDANVISLPGRFITKAEAEQMIDIFLNTNFEGGRHQARIDSIPLSC